MVKPRSPEKYELLEPLFQLGNNRLEQIVRKQSNVFRRKSTNFAGDQHFSATQTVNTVSQLVSRKGIWIGNSSKRNKRRTFVDWNSDLHIFQRGTTQLQQRVSQHVNFQNHSVVIQKRLNQIRKRNLQKTIFSNLQSDASKTNIHKEKPI